MVREESTNSGMILTADNSSDDAFFLHRALKEITALPVRHFPDGCACIDYLTGLLEKAPIHPQPRALILGLCMPRVDGFGVLDWLRPRPEFRHLPIIVLTGSNDPHIRARALGAGAVDYLTKPVDFKLLAPMLDSVWTRLALPR